MANPRDLLFKLGVASSPQAFAELKKFGDAARAEQKKIFGSGVAEMKKMVDDAKKSLGGGLVVQLKKERDERVKQARGAVLDTEKIYRRAELENFKFEQNLAKQIHRERLKHVEELKRAKIAAARDEARELQQEARRAAMAGRYANTRHLREQQLMAMRGSARWGAMEGVGRMGHGALEIGRAAAYSGMVGEENSQAVIDMLLRVESILGAYRGAGDVLKGARNVGKWLKFLAGFGGVGAGGAGAGGLAALGGGALATVGAIGAAAAGSGLGAWSIYETQRDIREFGFGGGSRPGSFNDRVGTGMANFGYGVARITPNWAMTGGPAEEAVRGERDIARRNKDHAASMAQRSEIAAIFQDYAQRKLDAAGERGGDVRGTFRDAATRLQNLPQAAGGEARAAAEEYVLKARERLLDLLDKERQTTIETARERVSGAREAMSLAREYYGELKRQAEESKQNLSSDMARFGMASPEEQARLREIARKRMAGEQLTEDEIRAAQGYNEFGVLAQSEAERRARAAGAGDIFTSGRSESERLAKEAAGAAASVSKAEVTLRERQEVIVRLEADENLSDAVLEQFEPLLADLDAQQRKMRDEIINRVDAMFKSFANGRVVK